MGCGTVTTHKAIELEEKAESVSESELPTDRRKRSRKVRNGLFVVEEESALLEQSPSQSRPSLPLPLN